MAKVNASSLKQWQDGETMHGPDYNQERDLIVAATNDTQDQVNLLKGAGGIGTSQLQDSSVTTPKIADANVTTAKIANGAVTSDKILNGAVTADKIAPSSIAGTKIMDSTIPTEKLVDNSVTRAKLDDNSVDTDSLIDGSVTAAKLDMWAVTNDKIARDAVTDSKIQNFAVLTDKINTGAVTSEKLADGAVTPSKIVEDAVTQFSYTKAQTNQQINNAISGGLPQEVIDQIVASIGDVKSQTVNVLGYDVITPAVGSEELLGGVYLSIIDSVSSVQAWCDSVGVSSLQYEPVLLRTTADENNQINAVQELFMSTRTTPRNPVVFKRVSAASNGGIWSAWVREETTAGAQAKADAAKTAANAYATEVILPQANANAQNYADANFRKPSEILTANLVKNSSGLMGFTNWKDSGSAGKFGFSIGDPTMESYFYVGAAVANQDYAVLDSDPINVSPQAGYLLQAVFHTAGMTSGSVLIELKNASNFESIGVLVADVNRWWHRKTAVIVIPAGVTSVVVRLVVTNATSATKAFSRIGLTLGDVDVPYSQEGDVKSLYTQTEAVKQSGVDAKNRIVGAINAKGGSASTSDTWPTLESKVLAIETGPKYATGLVTSPAPFQYLSVIFYDGRSDTGGYPITVSGLTFKPKRIIITPIPTSSSPSTTLYSEDEVMNGYPVYMGNYSYSKIRVDGSITYVNQGGFKLTVREPDTQYRWHAYG